MARLRPAARGRWLHEELATCGRVDFVQTNAFVMSFDGVAANHRGDADKVVLRDRPPCDKIP